jgi:putative Holliday junction resolvase
LLALDVGSVRIGVAVSDPHQSVAVPVTTLARGRGDLEAIAHLVQVRGVAGVIVGLPRSLSGGEGPAAHASRAFAAGLARRLDPIPVRLVDERFTTTSASRDLRDAGVRSRQARHVVDQVAATAILQAALDMQRTTGRPAGEAVSAAEHETGDETRSG